MTESLHLKQFDFEKTCRGCLVVVEGYGYTSLIDECVSKQISIIEKFEFCTSLKVDKADQLPNILCKKCLERLEEAYALRMQCKNSDVILRKYLKTKVNNIQNIKEETHGNITSSDRINTNNKYCMSYVNVPNKNSECHVKKTPKKGDSKIYSCSECNKTFKSLLSLKSHRKLHDKEVEECSEAKSIVEQTDSNFTPITGTKDTSEAKLTCNVCNKTYLKASNLAAHMGLHTGIKPYHCKICGKRFTQGRAYACHMRTHNATKPHICSKCDLQFENETDLKVHENEENSSCKGQISSTNQQKITLSNSKTNCHTCPVCGRNYCNVGNLRAHMRLHTGDHPYSCNICGRKFAQSNAHSYHMKTHLGERPFICDLCPKSFTTNGQLINHRRLHTGEKPYACTICPKRFTQKVTYTVHMMSHTGNKPHLCSVCGKKYSQNSQLVEHMRSHNGEKYKCEQCGKTYTTAGNLAAHIRTHSGVKPHSCLVCGKSFYVANKLAKHMRSHTGERPFPCPVCPKRFTCSGVLTVHLRTHTGERPFVCTVCNKGFTNNSQLTVHFKTHADEQTFTTSVDVTSTCVDPITTVYDTTCDNYNINNKRLYTL